MLFYIPGTQGRLFRSEEDKFIRSSSGKKLKVSDVEGRWITEKDLENLLWVEKKGESLELTYSVDKKVLIEEYEKE